MSIKAMTWAFGLPLEPRAKIALLAIADNARDDGIAWPSRDLIAEKSSQSRATINRRLKLLSDLGVVGLFERFREDGSQTTDEIRLNMSVTADEVSQRIAAQKTVSKGDSDSEETDEEETEITEENDQGGHQSDTPPTQQVTQGGYHYGNPQDEPSLEPSNPPPSPPPMAGGPLPKIDREANEKREALWRKFLGAYPGIVAMDQDIAKFEFLKLALDHCEWAVNAASGYAAECQKLRKPPKNAHIWLRKGMFKNLPPTGRAASRAPGVYPSDSPEAKAIKMLHEIAGRSEAYFKIWRRPDGSVNFPKAMTPQLLALAQSPDQSEWVELERNQAGAWEALLDKFFDAGVQRHHPKRGSKAPWPWPPKSDGTVYTATGPPPDTPETLMTEEDHAHI